MRRIFRSFIYIAVFIIPIVLTAALGLVTSVRTSFPKPADADAITARMVAPAAPAYDPTKPTVAVVLGAQVHEITDTIGPYAILRESGLYNVYMVADSKTPRPMGTRTAYTMTSALDVIPHYTFAELDTLLGHSPDIVVVPQMLGVDAPENKPLLAYIRQHAQGDTLTFSWCTGANVLAAAGVLDGKPATAHWGDIDRLEQTYPQVQWQRGLRYVDAGNVLTTGGVTSGIDGTLYLLAKLHGVDVAERVARALHYQPAIELDASPTVEQYRFGPRDSILLLNAAFDWSKRDLGVWVYDGIGDMELTAVLDAYPVSLGARTYTVADARRVVTTQYGLQLIPHWDVIGLPVVDRFLVPGAPSTATTDASLAVVEGRIGAPIVRLHDSARPRFAFEAPLEDLARDQSVPIAAFANKRLEYRASSLQLNGAGWPLLLLLQPLLTGALGVALAQWIVRSYDQRRQSRGDQARGASLVPASPAR
jgi:AraC family transcriptional regulator, transcriptional activator FtrA